MQNVTSLTVTGRTVDLLGDGSDDSWETVQAFADDEYKKIEIQIDILQQKQYNIQDMNFEDRRFRKKVETLGNKSISIEQIYEIWMEVTKPDREKDAFESAVTSKAHSPSSSLKYFVITNARGNKIHILADDANVARYIAYQNGRIAEKSNGDIRSFGLESIEKLPHGTAILAALDARWPGELEIMGNHVVHKGKKTVFG